MANKVGEIGLHPNDLGIVVANDLSGLDLMNQFSGAGEHAKAAHIQGITPPNVTSFFLDTPDQAHVLTYDANPRNIFHVTIENGAARLPRAFKNVAGADVSEFLERAAFAMAGQTLNPKTGQGAEAVKIVIYEHIATKNKRGVATAKLHADLASEYQSRPRGRMLRGHIGISNPREPTEHDPTGTRELEYLTVGVGENRMSASDIQKLLGYEGFAEDHDGLRDRMSCTHTGDFVSFWGLGPHTPSLTDHTLIHRTDPGKAVEVADKRRYSVIFVSECPEDGPVI